MSQRQNIWCGASEIIVFCDSHQSNILHKIIHCVHDQNTACPGDSLPDFRVGVYG